MSIRSRIGNMIWIAFSCTAAFILTGAVWIRRTYGVWSLAMADEAFRSGLRNKRTLFAKYVILPTVILFFILLVIHKMWKKPNRRIVTYATAVCVALSVCFAAVSLDVGFYLSRQHRMNQEQWYDTDHVIIHALGRIDDAVYTNSREALENSWQKGNRLLECDLIMTADGQLVACHDWEFWNRETYGKSSPSGEYIPTLDVFMNSRVMGRYTPLSGEDIVVFLREHPDAYIITDTKYAEPDLVKEQFQALADVAAKNGCQDTLDRFVVQIYHRYMYDMIDAIYPFPNYIFTLYSEGYRGEEDKMKEYAEFCMLRNIDVITMNAKYYHDELAGICSQYNIQMFVHTVNDENEIRAFHDKGIGVYTDNPSE